VTEYSKPYTLVHEGAALAEAQSIEVSYNSNDKPVKTMLKGLSGFSDGAEEVSLNVRNAVPLAGFEVDFAGVFCMKHRTLAFTVREANAVTTFEGRIISVTSGSGVDAENAQTFQFHGKMLSRMVV